MFQKGELNRLHKRKALLILQSEANRQRLAEDCRRVSSPDFWLGNVQGAIQRHPSITAALAAAGGMLAIKFLRKPGGIMGTLGQVGKLIPMAMTLWRLFRKQPKP